MKERGATLLSIVNVIGSALDRESDHTHISSHRLHYHTGYIFSIPFEDLF